MTSSHPHAESRHGYKGRIIPVVILAAIAWALLGVPHTALCQEDPFGVAISDADSTAMGAADAFSNPNAAAGPQNTITSEGSSYLQTDPLVLRVRQSPPKTPAEMAKAITWMVQLRSWDTVGLLMDQLSKSNWPLSARAELARAIDPKVWVVLLGSTGNLSEAQAKVLRSTYAAPVNQAKEPKFIDAMIDQLASSDSRQQQLAQLRLQDGQAAALNRLLDRLLADDDKVPAPVLAATISQFDRDGLAALRAACCHPNVSKRAKVLLALSQVQQQSSPFAAELASGMFSSSLPAEVRLTISQQLQKSYTRVPDQFASADFVARKFDEALVEYQLQRSTAREDEVTLWHVATDGKIVSRQSSRQLAALERLMQLAMLRAEIDTSAEAAQEMACTVALQRAFQWNPVLIDTAVQQHLAYSIPASRSVQADFWINVFRKADTWQMHGAAVRSLQLMTQYIQAGTLAAPLDFLSQSLSDARPVIRYMAFQAIATADPQTNFAGSSQALATAMEMAQLALGPMALIVGGNTELCMSADQMIQQYSSTESIIVHSGRAAFIELAKQNPIELILVVDRVHDLRLYELLVRLRNSGSLPIAVLVDGLSQSESSLAANSPGMLASVLSRDPQHMKTVVDQMLRGLDVKPMAAEDRAALAVSASSFLTKVSGDRNTYAFYPVDEWFQQLSRIRNSLGSSAQAKILSGLGTRDSQQQLVAMASTVGLSEADVKTAASCFNRSVKQFGLLLSDAGVKQCYASYNQLGPNNPAIATALGHILDVIEAQSGMRDWPSNP